MTAPQPSPTLKPDHVAAIRAADRADMLRELAEIGMEMARALQARMRALSEEDQEDDPSPSTLAAKGEVALAFSRVARGVRQTLALEARLERGERDRLEREQAGPAAAEPGRSTRMPDGSSMKWGATPARDPAERAAKADAAFQKFRHMASVLRGERDCRRYEAAERAVRELKGERPDWHPRDEIDWDAENNIPVQASLAEKFVGACLDLNVDPGDVLRRGAAAIYDLGTHEPEFVGGDGPNGSGTVGSWVFGGGDALEDEDGDEDEPEGGGLEPPGTG